jgi:hypothetical protein
MHTITREHPNSYNPSSPSSPIIRNTDNITYYKPNGEIFLTVGTGGRDLHEFVGGKPPYVVTEQDLLHGFLSLKFTDNGSSVTGRFFHTDKINAIDEFTVVK